MALWETVSSWRPSRAGTLRAFLYFLYGTLVFSLIFCAKYYIRQTDTLARAAVAGLQGVTVEFSRLEPQLFPLRVTLDYLRVFDAKTLTPLLELNDAEIGLSARKLLTGKIALSLRCRMYGGVAEGAVGTGGLFDFSRMSLDIRADMLEMAKIPQVRDFDKSLKGYVTFEASLDGKPSYPLLMEGNVSATLRQLDMENRFPVVKGARLAGYDLTVDCAMDNGVFDFGKLDVTGANGVSLQTEGRVKVDPADFGKSVIEMKGSIAGPAGTFATSVIDPKAVAMLNKKQAVPIGITGSISNVIIRVR
ncbi:MAG: hypothetical protein V3571_11405 [Pseudodesulfovibrio sp.]